MRSVFCDALKAAGLGHERHEVRPLRFNDLRHTFGTLAVPAWPLVDVQAYMGHAHIQTTMNYAHHVPRPDAADTLTDLVNRAGRLLSSRRQPPKRPSSARRPSAAGRGQR